MSTQAAYSIAYMAIVSSAGLVHGVQVAWMFAALTAALSFFAHEAGPTRANIANALAVSSWITGAAAGLSLLV